MLIRFEVSNFRSLRHATKLSLVTLDQASPAARRAERLGESLLTVVGIYGPSASGKSTVIAALTWLCDAVRNSPRYWAGEIPIESFAFGDGPQTSSKFTLEFLVDDVRFEYIVELDRSVVHYEGLFHYPAKRRRRIFERDGAELRLARGLGNISGTREPLTGQTLALPVAHRFTQAPVSSLVHALMRTQTVGPVRRWRDPRIDEPCPPDPRSTESCFGDPPAADQAVLYDGTEFAGTEREQALALLRMADPSVVDVRIGSGEVQFSMPGDTASVRSRRRVRLLHEAAGQRMPIDLIDESAGIQNWFQLIGPALFALRSGAPLLFDELNANLHPVLAAELIRLFHNPALNPKGAQLIFTTHNPSLLEHLGHDQIWLTERNLAAQTHLHSPAELAGG